MANKPQYTREDVNSVADAVIKNPGVPVDSTNFPAGMEDEVVNEINARQQHHDDIKAAMDKAGPMDRANASAQHSVVDDQGKDMDPDHSAPMAGLLGASDALTLGHTDELAGLIGAIDGNGYEPVRDAVREKQSFARENHPFVYHGMGVLGATQLPGPAGSGVGLGAVAGEGFSNRKLSDPGMNDDVQGGALMGGALEPLLGGAGSLVKHYGSKLAKSMAGDFWDPVLMRALFPGKGGSDQITTLMANDASAAGNAAGPGAKEVADVVRSNSKFPYLSPQSTKDAIQVPAIAAGRQGTIKNPIESGTPVDLDVAGPGPGDFSQNTLDGAMKAGYGLPKTIPAEMSGPLPAQPPLSPAERVATQGLTNMSDAPSNGMDPSTMLGGMGRMVQKNIVGPTAIGIPKTGQAMLRMIEQNPGDFGLKAASLKGIITHVMSSSDPSFSDYLAKETFPEYLALSLKADKEDESKAK